MPYVSQEEFDVLRDRLEEIDRNGTQGAQARYFVWNQQRERALQWAVLSVVLGFLLFVGANASFTVYEVHHSQAIWCHIIDTLNSPPAPPGSAETNPSRAYEQQLAMEFRELKANLGC